MGSGASNIVLGGWFRLVCGLGLLLPGCSVPEPGDRDLPPLDTGEERPAELGTLVGTVLDDDGTAVSGARIVTSPHGYEASTDTAGAWTVRHLPAGDYEVLATLDGASTAGEATVHPDAETTLSLTLPDPLPTGVTTVTVRGPDALPLEGAVVSTEAGDAVLTDPAGVATLVASAGQTVDLRVTDAGGLLFPRTLRDVAVPEVGGVQLEVTLSGRPPADATAIGSALCLACHASHASWEGSAHGNAVASEPSDELAAAFVAGEGVDLGGPTATLSSSGGDLQVTLTSGSGEVRVYPVDGFLGDPRSGTVPYTDLGSWSWPLPLGWVGADPYREAWPEGVGRLVPWGVDTWFDAGDAFAFASGATPEPARSADAACLPCHVTGFELETRADGGVDLTSTGSGGRWASDGVGCERCHGPGSGHLDGSGDVWQIVRPDHLDPERADDVCAQCHGGTEGDGTGLPYPYSADLGLFRPGDTLADHATSTHRTWDSGAAAAPGRQSDELADSAHGSVGAVGLRCFDCHDSHDASGEDASLRLDHRDNSLCLGCHIGTTFGGDQAEVEDHARHWIAYDPEDTEIGRCTGCHMPRTTARLSFGERSGAGDLSSHLFTVLSPRWTLDVFDAEGASVLEVGRFPVHSCGECHAYQAWREEQTGGLMLGATGDPTLRETHEAFLTQYEGRFP